MKPIAHFEDRYKISIMGYVMNLANNTFLTPIQNPNGYLKVGLANGDGTHTQVSIHRLVALHYLPNPYDYSQVNHIDGNKQNNILDNLEWCSPSQNIQHAVAIGLRPGYMSAHFKEDLLQQVIAGADLTELAGIHNRRPEVLTKALRATAERLGCKDQWTTVMKKRRRVAAIKNLEKANAANYSKRN